MTAIANPAARCDQKFHVNDKSVSPFLSPGADLSTEISNRAFLEKIGSEETAFRNLPIELIHFDS